MRKLLRLSKTLLVAAGLLVGVSNAWADATTLYERGNSTAWSEDDLTEWVNSGGTLAATIGENGLTFSANNLNPGPIYTKSITTTANSIVTLDATFKAGGAPNRDSSYDYIKIGGISFRFYEVNKVVKIDVDGSESEILNNTTRAALYNIQVIINQATGSVTYSCGSASGTTSSTTTVNSVVIGHYRGGREGAAYTTALKTISVSEEVQSVTMADYTVKYKCGGEEIKDADTSRSGVVGTYASLTASDKASFLNDGATKKYIYVSDDSESNAIAEDGSTVITVTFREAASWSYTVNAMNGGSKIEEVTTASVFEQENVTIPFHKYYNIDGTLYQKDAISSEYRQAITVDEDNKVVELAYTASDKTNVIFFKEAEDIATLTAVDGGGTTTRCSYAKGAYATEEQVITTLTPGKYKLWGAGYGGNLVFKAGATEILNMPTAGYWREIVSEVFTIEANTDITFIGGAAGGGASLDYVIIQRTAATPTITSAGWATLYSDCALDFSGIDGLTAYTATYNTSTKKVELTQVNDIQANTGVVLKGAANTYNIPVAASSSTASGELKGSATDAKAYDTDYNYYYLAINGESKAQFKKLTSGSIAAGKAYLQLDKGITAPSFDIDFGGTTGINMVKGEESKVNGEYYNLAGQRVAQPTKGLYIVNGKKVVIK